MLFPKWKKFSLCYLDKNYSSKKSARYSRALFYFFFIESATECVPVFLFAELQ